jgi:hypothetical protein
VLECAGARWHELVHLPPATDVWVWGVFATMGSRGLNLYWFWKIVKIVLGGKAQKEHVDEDKINLQVKLKSS